MIPLMCLEVSGDVDTHSAIASIRICAAVSDYGGLPNLPDEDCLTVVQTGRFWRFSQTILRGTLMNSSAGRSGIDGEHATH
jgi:hypothetical protein